MLMVRALASLFRRPFSFLPFFRESKRRPIRKVPVARLGVEQLEDRRLLAAPSWTLQQVLNAYNDPNSGARAIVQESAAIAGALGLKLPMVNETLTSALNLARDFQAPFQIQPGGPDWNTVQSQLQSAGFSILVPFTGSTDANGNLLEVSWTLPATWNNGNPQFTASGNTGFSYLDPASGAGALFGAITTVQAPSVSFQVTLGVDVQNNNPSFFVLDSSALTVSNLVLQAGLSGNLAIGSLANVDASATATLTVNSASLTLNNIHGDHKLRAADFAASGTVSGNVQGSATLNATLTAHLPLVGDVSWSPVFNATINNGWQQGSVNLNPAGPGQLNAQNLLSSLGNKFFSTLSQSFFSGGGTPMLGSLQSELNQPLPLINESIAQLTGLDSDLPQLPNLGSLNPSNVLSSLAQYGIQVNDGDTSLDPSDPNGLPAMVSKLIQGQTVDLISWSTGHQTKSLANYNITIPIFSFGIPDIASAEVDATLGLNASLTYNVGFGIDTNGLWIKAGSPSDPTLGLSFAVSAGLQGQVEVLGFPLAKVGGNIGFTITPYLALTAPPYSANPGRVYMSDLEMFGSNPVNDFLDALSAGIKGDFTGNVYASIDLFFFSMSWNWGMNIPVFNYVHNPTWPAPGSSGAASLDPYPQGPDPTTGILTFNGTANADYVNLKQIGPGTVQLTWANHGPTHTYTNVKEVDFHGNGGDDRLMTAPGFDIPIKADAVSGNAFLQGGDAGNTLTGGSGAAAATTSSSGATVMTRSPRVLATTSSSPARTPAPSSAAGATTPCTPAAATMSSRAVPAPT
jgi:hypothetical protein